MPSNEDPLENSARTRLESFLSDRPVSQRGREVHEGVDHSAVAIVATVDDFPETVSAISSEVRDGFAKNARIAHSFAATFGLSASEELTPSLLDQALVNWMEAQDKRGYTDEATIAVLGAAFGKYCAETLNMEWVEVQEGTRVSNAVCAYDCDVRAYPYDMIAKRLPGRELGYFSSVYLILKNNVQMARLNGDA